MFNAEITNSPPRDVPKWYPRPTRRIKQQRTPQNIHCVNCGERGHVFKECLGPITSFGIIAFREFYQQPYLGPILSDSHIRCIDHPVIDTISPPPSLRDPVYLLVQRKDTMGYIDFIRGKYNDDESLDPQQLIETYVSEMTCDERYRIEHWSFEKIWDKLWINHNSRCYRNEYKHAKSKFIKVPIKALLLKIPCKWTHQEFGFPKGRRSLHENNLQCAIREFCEETGYLAHHLDILYDEAPLCEIFTGTNHKQYKHVYYLARVKVDAGPPRMCFSNMHQVGEIRNVGWYSRDQCHVRIRKYDTTKLEILEEAHHRVCHLLQKEYSNVTRRTQ